MEDELLGGAARALTTDLDLDLHAARTGVGHRVRRRRRQRAAIPLAGVLVVAGALAVAVTASGSEAGPRDIAVGQEGGSTTEAGSTTASSEPASTTVPSTTSTPEPATTAVPDTTAAPGTTQVIRVESALGDVYDLTLPDASLLAAPTSLITPLWRSDGAGFPLEVTVERGDGAAASARFCTISPFPEGCVATDTAETSPGNTFVRWRLRNPEGEVIDEPGSTPELATVSDGTWSILLAGPDEQAALDLADQLSITTSATGGPRVTYDGPGAPLASNPGGDVLMTFYDEATSVAVDLYLTQDCTDLPPGWECRDDVGVLLGGDPALVEEIRAVLEITRTGP